MNFFLRIVLIPHTRKQAKKAKSAAGRKRRLARALREADAALAKWEKEQAEGGNPATSSFMPIESTRGSMGYGVTKEDVAKVYAEYIQIITAKANVATATTSNDGETRKSKKQSAQTQTLGERFGVWNADVLNTLQNEFAETTPVAPASVTSPKNWNQTRKNKTDEEMKRKM